MRSSNSRIRVKAAKFRWLNEKLYQQQGRDTLDLARSGTGIFETYHEGYRLQVSSWPLNPLDRIVGWIFESRPKTDAIGDFGCGEGKLEARCREWKVHSFDAIVKTKEVNPQVTQCNIANVPLPSGSLDVVVFCLSLMGTDWPSFVAEAFRTLKSGGVLKIAEVSSRCDNLDAFVATIESMGFISIKTENFDFFFITEFQKWEESFLESGTLPITKRWKARASPKFALRWRSPKLRTCIALNFLVRMRNRAACRVGGVSETLSIRNPKQWTEVDASVLQPGKYKPR